MIELLIARTSCATLKVVTEENNFNCYFLQNFKNDNSIEIYYNDELEVTEVTYEIYTDFTEERVAKIICEIEDHKAVDEKFISLLHKLMIQI